MHDILFIDNFDSFTYNLVDEFERRRCKVTIYRNDLAMEYFDRFIEAHEPLMTVISPGPSHPRDAGICIEFIRKYAERLPIFGVCLGHQCMIESFGGTVGYAGETVHGKISPLCHNGKGLYEAVPNPLPVGRYHSLAGTVIPEELEVTARCGAVVMSLQHRRLPLLGVQYHPESLLTAGGDMLFRNLFRIMEEHQCSKS